MPGILVIAHAPLASALVSASRHVYSRDPCVASRRLIALDVAPDADVGAATAQARAGLAEADRGDGVLVLTDLLGATPGNVAASLVEPGRVAVVSGASMPMLLRALCYSTSDLEDVVEKALHGAVQGAQRVAAPGPGPEGGEGEPA